MMWMIECSTHWFQWDFQEMRTSATSLHTISYCCWIIYLTTQHTHTWTNDELKTSNFHFFFFFWNENSWAQFKFIDSLNSHFKNRMNKKRMKKIITSVFVLCVHHLHTKCIRYFFFSSICVCLLFCFEKTKCRSYMFNNKWVY